jgi:hypothetical protein
MIANYLLYILGYTESSSTISSESSDSGLHGLYTVRVLQHRPSRMSGSDTRE